VQITEIGHRVQLPAGAKIHNLLGHTVGVSGILSATCSSNANFSEIAISETLQGHSVQLPAVSEDS
jgi:hypothetical protein